MLIVITGSPEISDNGKDALLDAMSQNGVPALAIGDEATLEVTANLNYADYGSRTRWDAIEGISGSRYVVTPWIEPIPYLPNITVRDADGHNFADYPNYASLFGYSFPSHLKTLSKRFLSFSLFYDETISNNCGTDHSQDKCTYIDNK